MLYFFFWGIYIYIIHVQRLGYRKTLPYPQQLLGTPPLEAWLLVAPHWDADLLPARAE